MNCEVQLGTAKNETQAWKWRKERRQTDALDLVTPKGSISFIPITEDPTWAMQYHVPQTLHCRRHVDV